jgi:hypothetical protein
MDQVMDRLILITIFSSTVSHRYSYCSNSVGLFSPVNCNVLRCLCIVVCYAQNVPSPSTATPPLLTLSTSGHLDGQRQWE